MSNQPDLPSRSEKTSIALAAASDGPWAVALAGGAAVGLADFGINLLHTHLTLAGPASSALMVFFAIGTAGALLRRGYDRTRAWAQAHPWTYAMVPAAGTAVTVYAVDLFLSSRGPLSSAWDALGGGFAMLLLIALVGYVARAVRPAKR